LPKIASRHRTRRLSFASPSPLSSSHPVAASSTATLGEKVYRALKRDIIHGVYQPGESLNEKDLARRYKGSRTPVREAAVRLQNERLLRIIPNRGYFVTQITLQVLNDIYEFRCAVECEAAQLAAFKGGDPEILRKLSELAGVTCRADDRQSCVRFIEADTAFHTTVARLSRNQIDIEYYGEAPSREHREILKAIQDRDPERARKRMYEHVVQSKDKVLGLTGFASSPR
jgi:GntR family transcriptional regulator, rspAB operon transcriptional repressor